MKIKAMNPVVWVVLILCAALAASCKNNETPPAASSSGKSSYIASSGEVESSNSVSVQSVAEASSAIQASASPQTSSQTASSKASLPVSSQAPITSSSSAKSSAPASSAAVSSRTTDIGKTLEKEDYTIIIESAGKKGAGEYEMVLTLTFSGKGTHPLNAKDRFFIVDTNKKNIAVTNIYDSNGDSLLGYSLASGESKKIRAVYDLTAGFEVDHFKYFYEIFGFRYIQAVL